MDRGIDFLKGQVSNAVMQHRTVLQSIEDHENQAHDPRFRDLCTRHIPRIREHHPYILNERVMLVAIA